MSPVSRLRSSYFPNGAAPETKTRKRDESRVLQSAALKREKPRGSPAFASPSRGSQSKRLPPFRHTSDSGLTLRLRCRLGSSGLRFYPSPVGRCRSAQNPRVPIGHRSTLRQFGVTHRDLGGPDGHWHLAPKRETPIREADRSRSPGDPSGPAPRKSPSAAPVGPRALRPDHSSGRSRSSEREPTVERPTVSTDSSGLFSRACPTFPVLPRQATYTAVVRVTPVPYSRPHDL